MPLPLPLSVLDLAPVVSGATSAQTIRNSIALASLCDRLGYIRYWFAEHHNMPMIAATTPALLIALAAPGTERIRFGAGGVMLPNHSPLQVAEAYRMLAAMWPGRIDLGLGRAPGTDSATALALRRAPEALGANDFPEQLAELLAFSGGGFPPGHPFRGVRAMPEDAPLPPLWLLGSSGYSAQLAAQTGHGFGFAAHFSPEAPDGPMLAYRTRFRPGALPRPHAILALAVICADSTKEAERLAAPMQLAWVRLRSGRIEALPSPEEALAHPYSPAERAIVEVYKRIQIVGDPVSVKASIEQLAARTQADEVMVTTVTHDAAARRRSYELLAQAFALPAA